MNSDIETYDFLVVGSGLFGAYAALYFSEKGLKVLLVDREVTPWKKASIVNQARVHFGYHYPRSIATAKLANDHRSRFEAEHNAFINRDIEKYYGIDRQGSLTSAEQFQRFCDYLKIPCYEVARPDLFNQNRFEALFRTTEYSFDPFLIRTHYLNRLKDSAVTCLNGCWPEAAEVDGVDWVVNLARVDGEKKSIRVQNVFNATYTNINAVNHIFGIDEIEISHEISEIALLHGSAMNNIGLTVMDGPYMSVMPYGLSSFHSLSSVLYTHHAVSYEKNPTFNCQKYRSDCSPEAVRSCTNCFARPRSNLDKMLRQLRLYVRNDVGLYSHGSIYTVKAKLKSSFVDDARPTDVRIAKSEPLFAYVFSGKINSIYEVENLYDAIQ